jgi:ABC-type bacteriocin/lantibiotic exporter with double-glycine peptidase domain
MRTPELIEKTHYRQQDKAACIPASFRMVVSHFDAMLAETLSEADMIALLGTGATGSLLEHLPRLNALGFEAISEEWSPTELALHLRLQKTPVIVVLYAGYVEYLQSDTLHAVVVIGMDAEKVYLNDPLRNETPIVFSIDEFNRAWSFWDNTVIHVRQTE